MIAKIQKYFSFEGKATRLEFWIGFVFIPPASILLLAFFGHLLSNSGLIIGFTVKFVIALIFVALFISCIWLIWATAVRRCHDLCISPNYIFLFLIPSVNTLTFLVFAFAKVDVSKLSDNTKLEQRKRVLRWHLKALIPVAIFWIVIFLIKYFFDITITFS